MLSKVLDKSTCAACRFCCSFRRCSLWETPLFPADFPLQHKTDTQGRPAVFAGVTENGEKACRMQLQDRYESEDPEAEAPCFFLDPHRGCTLPEEEKPFDCKIWPLRIMRKEDGTLVIALTPTCPAITKQPLAVMQQLVKEGLGDTIYTYAKAHPYMIKAYKTGFPILQEWKG